MAENSYIQLKAIVTMFYENLQFQKDFFLRNTNAVQNMNSVTKIKIMLNEQKQSNGRVLVLLGIKVTSLF